MRAGNNNSRREIFAVAIAAIAIFAASRFSFGPTAGGTGSRSGSARLVSIEQLPEVGDMCERVPAGANSPRQQSLFAEFEETPVYAQESGATVDVTRQPVRDILDTAPIYSSVGVDVQRNEVLLQDANTWSIKVFSRTDNARPGAPPTEPRRVIGGHQDRGPIQQLRLRGPCERRHLFGRERHRRRYCRVSS